METIYLPVTSVEITLYYGDEEVGSICQEIEEEENYIEIGPFPIEVVLAS